METNSSPVVTTYQDPDAHFGESQHIVEGAKPAGLLNLSSEKVEKFAEDRKQQEDNEVKKALSEGGNEAAADKKFDFIKEKLANRMGYFDANGKRDDVKIDEFLKSDVGQALQKTFYEAAKVEAGYTKDEEIPADIKLKLEIDSMKRAEEYKDKSLSEVAIDAVDIVLGNIDMGVFIFALIGKDVGEGRYGRFFSREEGNSSQEQPEDLLALAIEKYKENPEHMQMIFDIGFRACGLTEGAGLQGKDLVAFLKEHVLSNPETAAKFVWGTYNRMGHGEMARAVRPEQASNIISDLISRMENLEGKRVSN